MNEIIENPRGNREVASVMCGFINRRKAELLETARNTLDGITADNWKDPQTKAAIEDLADAVEDLRETGKKLVKAVVAETEAQSVLTQIDSRLWNYSTKADPECAYAKLSAVLKEIKAKVAAFKEAATPAAPARSFVVRIDATDKQFAKVADAATKAGCPFSAFATPQSDKAVKQIAKWFEENI